MDTEVVNVTDLEALLGKLDEDTALTNEQKSVGFGVIVTALKKWETINSSIHCSVSVCVCAYVWIVACDTVVVVVINIFAVYLMRQTNIDVIWAIWISFVKRFAEWAERRFDKFCGDLSRL